MFLILSFNGFFSSRRQINNLLPLCNDFSSPLCLFIRISRIDNSRKTTQSTKLRSSFPHKDSAAPGAGGLGGSSYREETASCGVGWGSSGWAPPFWLRKRKGTPRVLLPRAIAVAGWAAPGPGAAAPRPLAGTGTRWGRRGPDEEFLLVINS